jgi:ParB family chromosome partitioning protein
MTEFIRAQIKRIHTGDRLRPVDDERVAAMASSLDALGQISPIMVRVAPAKNKGETPLILVAGSYRLAAAKLLGWTEIDAIKVAADALDAQLREIAENLFRNELNALDRSIFVMKYRELWEERHGKIEQGGDRRSKGHDDLLKVFSSGRELSMRVQEEFGFGPSKYKRAVRIGQNLHPSLRAAVRGTKAERDQTKLLKLCRLSADEQIRIAAALREEPDVDLAMSFLKAPKPAIDPQAQLLDRLVKAWEQASDETREEFLATIGLSEGGDPLLRSIREAAE